MGTLYMRVAMMDAITPPKWGPKWGPKWVNIMSKHPK